MLEPSSRWYIDAGEDRCRLARKFGEDDNELMVFMEIGQPSNHVDMTIAGPLMDKLRWRRAVTLRFGELEPIEVESHREGSLEGYGTAFMTSGVNLNAESSNSDSDEGSWEDTLYLYPGLPSIDTVRYEGNETLTIAQGDNVRAILDMPNFHKALGALNMCGQNFIEFWGLDLEKQKTRSAGPRWTNMRDVVRRIQKRYPSKALEAGEQGSVRFRLMVDETGTVSDCIQFDATLMTKLVSPVCEEMARAKFEPALDAEGNPLRSYYATKVRYVLP